MTPHRPLPVLCTATSWLSRLFPLGVLLLFFLSSCEQDVYDKGEGRYSLMRADFVEAHANADKQLDYVVTDDGDSLTLQSPLTTKWAQTPDSTYRALLYYNKVDATAEVITIGQVPTATIRRLSDFKDSTMVQDPVKFESIWTSRNRRYLNVGIILMVGSTDDEDAIHRLGIVGDTIMQNADGTRTCHLRLYHDQGSMPEYYSQRTYFSVPLRGLDADSVRLSLQTYDGPIERTLSLNP